MSNPALYLGLVALMWWNLPMRTVAEDIPLRTLFDRSDLIVVATPQTVCGMCLGSGPYPNGVTPTPRYDTFYPRLKVDLVVKGDLASNKKFSINYTLLRFESKDPPKREANPFTFKIDPSAMEDEVGLPGSPREGTQYIFFLENREKRDSKSNEALGTENVIYRTFDFKYGMIPASPDTLITLSKLAKGG